MLGLKALNSEAGLELFSTLPKSEHVYVWGEQCSRYSKEQQESYCGWNEVTPVGGEERTSRK